MKLDTGIVFGFVWVVGISAIAPDQIRVPDWHVGLETASSAPDQWCQYRDVAIRYDATVFRLQASYGCYDYNAEWKFALAYNRSTNSANGMVYQCLLVDGVKVDVDYLNAESIAIVARSFKSQADTEKWKACSSAAEDCCRKMLDSPGQQDGCPATWDAWSCWPETGNNTWNQEVCPDYIYSGTAPDCHLLSSKECQDGAWNVTTDYSTCDITRRLKTRIRFHVAMLGTSLCFAVPAIVIFIAYRKLRFTMRVILHRNLLIAISARNICTIILKTVILWDALTAKDEESSLMGENGVGCRVLSVLEKLATNSVFTCMLLVGIYLHRLIAEAFRGQPNMFWFFIVGAAITCLPVIGWAAVMATTYDENCWTIDSGGIQWINDSVRGILLSLNLLLILDIVRVLLTKLRKVNTGNSQGTRRTIKATVWLVPVFGVQFIFTAVRPKTTNCLAEQIYYYFSYGLDGTQGAVVALLFCYLNKEVQLLLKKTFYTTRDKIRARFDSNYVSPGFESRRHTTSTLADPPTRNPSRNPSRNASIEGPSHQLDTTCVQPKRKVNKVDPMLNQEVFLTPRNSISNKDELFYTPRNSASGSSAVDSSLFYSPRSSLSGSSGLDDRFYDCVEDLDVKWRGVFDNLGFDCSSASLAGNSVAFEQSGQTIA